MIAAADNPNLAILELAVRALGELTDSLVFVGGCATGLLVTKTRANQIRATEDVDVVTQVATIGEYHRVETMLAARGFKHDTSAGRANLPLAEQRNYARPHAVATRCPELPQSLVSSRHRYRQPQ